MPLNPNFTQGPATVGALRELIKGLPDDAPILIGTPNSDYMAPAHEYWWDIEKQKLLITYFIEKGSSY